MATKQKQGAALGRKVTTAATNETGDAEQTAKTAKKTSAGSGETDGAEKTAKTATTAATTAATNEADGAEKTAKTATTAVTNETDGAEPTVKTANKTSAGSETRKSDKMKSFDEPTIQARAYWIWIEEGQPEGRDVEHWLRACEELEREAP